MSNTMWPKILLLGKNGQIGWELQRTISPLGTVIALDLPDLDLTKPEQIKAKISETKPDLIINTAAYTAVDKAEEEPGLAMAINGMAPGILAEEAKKLGATLVHYSTDYVFDGTNDEPYSEQDEPNPVNVYGRTKLAGEKAIQEVDGQHLIFRTSWVYGLRGNNFFLTVLRLLNQGTELRMVDDQIGAPTWCRIIAETTAIILARGEKGLNGKFGLYHVTAGGKTSWYGFATQISNAMGSNCAILPVLSESYTTKAKRPLNSVLSNDKLHNVFLLKTPDWEEQLACVLEISHENDASPGYHNR